MIIDRLSVWVTTMNKQAKDKGKKQNWAEKGEETERHAMRDAMGVTGDWSIRAVIFVILMTRQDMTTRDYKRARNVRWLEMCARVVRYSVVLWLMSELTMREWEIVWVKCLLCSQSKFIIIDLEMHSFARHMHNTLSLSRFVCLSQFCLPRI